MSHSLGAVRQLGYVVRNIEQAMQHWSDALGVGPWFYKEEVNTTEFRYYGKDSTPPALSIALANSGDLQIELIEQRDDAPSLYLDSLARGGEGAQHIAYWTVHQYDEYVARLLSMGYVEGHAGRMGANRGRFGYFLNPALPSAMIELSELTGGKAEYFENVKQVSCTWDGKDPIRAVAAPR